MRETKLITFGKTTGWLSIKIFGKEIAIIKGVPVDMEGIENALNIGVGINFVPRSDYESLQKLAEGMAEALAYACKATCAMPSGSDGNVLFHICQQALSAYQASKSEGAKKGEQGK